MNLSLILEVQMPKLWLGSIISRLQCWSKLHLHRDNSGCLGLTWSPWTTLLAECGISCFAPGRVVCIGFLESARVGLKVQEEEMMYHRGQEKMLRLSG